MSQERLLKILLAPRVTEKGTRLAEKHRQFVFKVLRDANKQEIKAAVESLFEVKVKAVQVLNVKGKERRFGQRIGRRQDWKKAYISLQEGYDINFAGVNV